MNTIEGSMETIYYRVFPIKAPVRFRRIESYPDEASALKRAEEIIYACNLVQEPAQIRVEIVRRSPGSLFIHTIAVKQSDTYGRS